MNHHGSDKKKTKKKAKTKLQWLEPSTYAHISRCSHSPVHSWAHECLCGPWKPVNMVHFWLHMASTPFLTAPALPRLSA